MNIEITTPNGVWAWEVLPDHRVICKFPEVEPFVLMGEPFDSHDDAVRAVAEDALDNVV